MRKQKWPTQLIIIRHGQSARNVAKDAAKQAGAKPNYSEGVRDQDTPLTAYGYQQAEAVGRWLKEEYDWPQVNTVLVSPYLRTRQTADRALEGLRYTPDVVIEERIREIEFGILDGLTPEGIRAKYPEEVERRKREGKYWYRAPGGESRPDVKDRIRSVLGMLTRELREKHVVVFTHSVVVLAFRALLERWGEEQYLAIDKEQDVHNCGILRYVYEEGRLEQRDYNLVVYPEQTL